MLPHLLLLVSPVLAAGPDTALVCPREYLHALQPWLAHRENQGHKFKYVSNLGTADDIRAGIRNVAREGDLHYIVLVGDADPLARSDRPIRSRCVPAHQEPARVNVGWGSEPKIGTDNWYADLDDDLLPDVAIGRLTADTPDELSVVIEKILAYERSTDMGEWRRRLNFVAGVGGFGMLADVLLEYAATTCITSGVPAAYETTMTYASLKSAYCPDPFDFQRITSQRLNEGCLVWAYLGHGHRTTLDHVRTPRGDLPILEAKDIEQLHCAQGMPIAIFLACYAGAFDQPTDCLAERMLRKKGAPVAVIGGSRVTMPYAMATFGIALLDEFFRNKQPTLGDVLLASKRQMALPAVAAGQRKLLDSLATAISPDPADLSTERIEHLSLFNLIGDPLLRLRHPSTIHLEAPRYAEAGKTIRVTGESPVAGDVLVELTCRRDRFKFPPASSNRYRMSDHDLRAMDLVYQQANDKTWIALRHTAPDGKFDMTIEIPENARGPCHVQAYIEGDHDCAASAVDVYIRKPLPAKISNGKRQAKQTTH